MLQGLAQDFSVIGHGVLSVGQAVIDLIADILRAADPGQGGRGGGGGQYPFA